MIVNVLTSTNRRRHARRPNEERLNVNIMRSTKILALISILFTLAVGAMAQNVERMFQTDVKIYLHKIGIAPNGPADTSLRPVERMVPADFKLEYALDALFEEELPDEEAEAGFVSPTYGLQFEGVDLNRGIATVRFSQPPEKNYEMYMPMIFVDAVTKTARQFRSVKRVSICAVGNTTVDSDLKKPFPRCPATR